MRIEPFERDGEAMERVIMDGGKTILVRPAGQPLARPKRAEEEKPVKAEPVKQPKKVKENA